MCLADRLGDIADVRIQSTNCPTKQVVMQTPLQLAFQDIPHSDAVETRVRDEAAKLEHFFDRITSMRVVVARPQHRHHKGDTYQIRIHMTVPGASDIVVNREPGVDGAHEDIYVTIRDAFRAARRMLQDIATKRQDHPTT